MSINEHQEYYVFWVLLDPETVKNLVHTFVIKTDATPVATNIFDDYNYDSCSSCY